MARTRKIRNDRVYLVYEIVNSYTGDNYIGITARIGQKIVGTLKERLRRHKSKAIHENKDWGLHNAMRRDSNNWKIVMLDSIRGRKNAYALEREYIAEHQPTLNEV